MLTHHIFENTNPFSGDNFLRYSSCMSSKYMYSNKQKSVGLAPKIDELKSQLVFMSRSRFNCENINPFFSDNFLSYFDFRSLIRNINLNKKNISAIPSTLSRLNISFRYEDVNPFLVDNFFKGTHFQYPTNINLEKKKNDTISKEKSRLELTREKIIPKPFNLDWLSKYLGLNKQYVNKSNFDFNIMRYSITFDNLENAQNFYLVLKQAGANPQMWEFSNTIEIAYSRQFEILRFVGQSDTGLNPCNIDFFVTYFDLNKDQVKDDNHNAYGYILRFHNPLDAYNYYENLIKHNVYTKEPYGDGILVINVMCDF